MSALEERKRRMREKGIPMPITQMNEGGGASNIPITASNQDKHARLAALKSGANRQQVQSLVKSKGGSQGFQGIPEAKVRKNPNNPANKLSDQKHAVKPADNFGASAPVSNEFNAMEAMYGGGNDRSQYSAPQQPVLGQQNAPMGTRQPELQIPQDGIGPSFNPQAMLQKKRAMEAQNTQPQEGYDYMQHAVNAQPQAQTQNQSQFDIQYMQQMMQEIAQKTISEVLSEYTEKNQKKGLTYENVKTKGDAQVIKTQDGKYYKLTPVTLTKG